MTPFPDVTRSQPVSGVPTSRQGVVFYVGGYACAIDLAEVQEIVPLAELASPPQSPPILAGLLNLGGRAVPVVRTTRLFQLTDVEPGLFTPLIVLRGGKPDLALLVDRVSRIVSVPADELLPIDGPTVFAPCAQSILALDGEPVTWLAVERLLLHQEQQCLADVASREQQRLAALREALA